MLQIFVCHYILTSTTRDIFRTLQRHLIDVCQMIMYLNFTVFFSNDSSVLGGNTPFFSGLLMKKKKMGPKK